MLMGFACFGIMLSYVTGAYMTYRTSPYVMMIFPVALFISFIFLPGEKFKKKTLFLKLNLTSYAACRYAYVFNITK